MESGSNSEAETELEKPTRPTVDGDVNKDTLNSVMDYADTWAEICTTKVLKALKKADDVGKKIDKEAATRERQITFITTNHLDKLDTALRRAGRIDKIINGRGIR